MKWKCADESRQQRICYFRDFSLISVISKKNSISLRWKNVQTINQLINIMKNSVLIKNSLMWVNIVNKKSNYK